MDARPIRRERRIGVQRVKKTTTNFFDGLMRTQIA